MQSMRLWGLFTPHGQTLADEVGSMNTTDARVLLNDNEDEDFQVCTVKSLNSRSPQRVVKIRKEAINGSRFGSCSCGVAQKDSVPCIQMASVVKSGRMPGLTIAQVMPWWWTTKQWRLQLPNEVNVAETASLTLQVILDRYHPNHSIRYCPDWTAARKAGRPKKGERLKGAKELAVDKKRKKGPRPYCIFCNKYNHTTATCWNHPRKKMRMTEEEEKEGNGHEDEDITPDFEPDQSGDNEDGAIGKL